MTTLRLFNTLTKTKEDFVPIDPSNVRMYVCGPTVYDYAHIGNARPAIVFDVLFRLLRHIYGAGHVTYVRNITDVDDKINARAVEIAAARNITAEMARAEITAATAQQYVDDVTALGCLPPTQTPRATDHIAQMIAMIGMLIQHGNAYASEGHVLFDVSSKHDYGKLSRRTVDDMIAGARVEVAPYKRNAMDFVLWKPSSPNEPGWDSPWGRGRPGWHIECSAMAGQYLGETFDIHGGGIDLQFPHHENEIAQSEGAHHGRPFANVWMHNGFLNVEGEKMSKSLGNFVTIRQLMRDWHGRGWSGAALRLTMLQTHYTQPINWTYESLEREVWELSNWVAAISEFSSDDMFQSQITDQPSQAVLETLMNDLNTPELMRVLREQYDARSKTGIKGMAEFASDLIFLGLYNPKNRSAYIAGGGSRGAVSFDDLFRNVDLIESLKASQLNNDVSFEKEIATKFLAQNILVDNESGHVTLRYAPGYEPPESEIALMIEARNAARRAKNFAESDRIRDELLAQGIVLKDGPSGTTWEVKR